MGKASTHFDMITYQKELRRTQHTFLNPVNGIIPHSHVQLSPRQPLYIVSLGEMQWFPLHDQPNVIFWLQGEISQNATIGDALFYAVAVLRAQEDGGDISAANTHYGRSRSVEGILMEGEGDLYEGR